jgi:protein tyrosine phosphatase (PTP) superfamily phosphohydrolase (DUF442 family)
MKVVGIVFVAGALAIADDSTKPDMTPSRSSDAANGEAVGLKGLTGPSMSEAKARNFEGLHNVVAFYKNYWSGSSPEGDAGFDELKAMGVKTIISVDGAAPNVEAAKARGIRYIHLPIGYNGFDENRKMQLIRASRDAMKEGPVYVHCHHGKHRSAGAAGTVAVSLGWGTGEEMVERMKVSGTAPDYKGLYACTMNAAVVDEAAIDAVPANFPEVSKPEGFVKAMVEIDEVFEYLKAIEKAGWITPKDHPDLVPVAEAGRLADLFRVLLETRRVQREPDDFREMMTLNGRQSQTLEDLLLAEPIDAKQLSAEFKAIEATCKACHVTYRDE